MLQVLAGIVFLGLHIFEMHIVPTTSSYVFPAVMDLTFLVMLIIRDGLCYGIFVNERPLWKEIIFPFGIVPMFYMLRFCTTYMLVVISIERCIALSNLLGYKTKCYSYILLVVLFSSELNRS